MLRFNDDQLYLCIVEWDIGAGHGRLETMWIISDEKPDKTLVETYLERTHYWAPLVHTIQKVNMKEYGGSEATVVSDDPEKTLQWVNDLDEMTRRAYERGQNQYMWIRMSPCAS